MYFLDDWTLNVHIALLGGITFISSLFAVLLYQKFNVIVNYYKAFKTMKQNLTPELKKIDFTDLSNIKLPDLGKSTSKFEDTLKKFEDDNNTNIIFLSHDISSNNSLSLKDAETIVEKINSADQNRSLSIFLNTPGGTLHAAEIIINAISNYAGIVNVYVPFYACSAGTIIALSAHNLYLAKNAHLGPFDPHTYGFSLGQLYKFLPNEDGPFGIIAYIRNHCKSAYNRVCVLAKKSIRGRFEEGKVIEKFAENVDFHDSPFFAKDLEDIDCYKGVMPDDYYKLWLQYKEKPSYGNSSSLSTLLNYFR